MEQAAERTDTELPFETYPDINGNAEDRETQADGAGSYQLRGHLARDGFDRTRLRGRQRRLDTRHALMARPLGRRLVALGKRGADSTRLALSELLDRTSPQAQYAAPCAGP